MAKNTTKPAAKSTAKGKFQFPPAKGTAKPAAKMAKGRMC